MKKLLVILLLSSLLLAGVAQATITQYNSTVGSDTVNKFNGTGGNMDWVVPVGVTSIRLLIVAGGGDGGSSGGGGGGAGGVIAINSYPVTAGQIWNVTVGAKNTNSSFNQSTTIKNDAWRGGNGGINLGAEAENGGSGGGAMSSGTTAKVGGYGLPGQGKYGGNNSNVASPYPAAGGGGNSTVGANTGVSSGGNGGEGWTDDITGTSICYAAGGGGGLYAAGTIGTGGCTFTGGNGSAGATAATNAKAETGSGGGGGGYGGTKGNGTSGIVIIRYSTGGGTPINASFTQSVNPSIIGQSVNFNDTSTGSPIGWNWTLNGGGLTNSTQNASYTYSSNGVYTIFLNVTNSTGSWSNTSQTHTVVNASGFTPADIWMEGEYVQTFHITDSSTGLPIPVVQLQDTAMQAYTTTNGTGYLTEPFGASMVTFVATGYSSRAISYVFDADATHSVAMTPAPPASTQSSNTLWTPHQVVFQCLDGNNNPIINTPISALASYTTLPGGMANVVPLVQSAYGLPAEAAIQLINSTTAMSGTTDQTGSAVFVMLPVIDYAVTFRDATGINYTTSIMPQDSYYQLNTPNATYQSQANRELAYIRNTNASIFNTTYSQTANGTLGTMGMHIYDSTGQTAGANCWWTLIDNSTTWWDNRTWALGSGLQTFGKTVVTTPYQQWKWGCTTL